MSSSDLARPRDIAQDTDKAGVYKSRR